VAPVNQGGIFIARGGAHDKPDYDARNAKRRAFLDIDRNNDVGFRVVRNQ